MTIFRTAYRSKVPSILPSTPLVDQTPMKYFDTGIPRAVNVFVTKAGVVTERQPANWTNDSGIMYGGGRDYVVGVDIDPITAANLVAGGHGFYATGGGGGTTDPTGYGQGSFGVGSFGA